MAWKGLVMQNPMSIFNKNTIIYILQHKKKV
jgi:hypothetical protein